MRAIGVTCVRLVRMGVNRLRGGQSRSATARSEPGGSGVRLAFLPMLPSVLHATHETVAR
jgi:hypothetical protein